MQNNISIDTFIDYQIFSVSDSLEQAVESIGENQKKLLLLCKKVDATSENIQFLQKILKAIQYDLQRDTLLLSITVNQPIRFSEWLRTNEIENILLFGIDPRQIGLYFLLPPYQILSHQNQNFLLATTLSNLKDNKDNSKVALWKAMQQMFG